MATSVVRKGHELNIDALRPWMAKHGLISDTTTLTMKQFSAGQSNPTYLISTSTDGQRFVLRKQPPGKLLDPTAHNMQRESNVMSCLYGSVPVPRVYTYCADTSVIGTTFYIMEFIDGRIFTDVRLLSIQEQDRIKYWLEITRVLARLHKVNIDAVGLSHLRRPGNFYLRQIKRLGTVSRKQACVKDVPALPNLEEMLDWFQKNVPDGDETVVHGDYKMDNVVFHPHRPELMGILDWELCAVGHPLSDLANLLLPFYIKGTFAGFPGLETTPTSPTTLSTLLQEYCKLTSRVYPIPEWKFCLAFSFFRMAVILQGVAARHRQGQASSAHAELYGSYAVPSHRRAWEWIQAVSERVARL